MKFIKLNFFIFSMLNLISLISFADNDNCNNISMSFNGSNIPESGVASFQVTVNRSTNNSNSNDNTCNFFLALNNGSQSSYQNRRLTSTNGNYVGVQFYLESGRTNILKSKSEGSSGEVFSGTFSRGGSNSITFTYYPYIANTANIPAGTYADTFRFDLYQGSFNRNANSVANASNTVTYTKTKFVDISLVSSNNPFNINDTTETLNFPNMKKDDIGSFDIVLQYNFGYKLSMQSANEGKLKRVNSNPVTVTDFYVPYTMSLNGSTISLSNVMEEKINSGVVNSSPAGGTRVPVSVKIGNFSGAPGTYTDTVSISVTSLN